MSNLIHIIAPSNTMADLPGALKQIGINKLESLGFKLQFGKHANNKFLHMSGTITQRLDDLKTALEDPNVCGVMAVFGGYNTSDLLLGLDRIVVPNNKWIIGYSDITALLLPLIKYPNINVIHGPGFASFCDPNFFDYSANSFLHAVKECEIAYESPNFFASDQWYLKQGYGPRVINQPSQWSIYQPGEIVAPIIGGNLDTLCALLGTPYFPDLKERILFLEDATGIPGLFQRNLIQLKHAGVLDKISGLILGKFPHGSSLNSDNLIVEILNLVNLPRYPTLLNVHCSHVDPMISIPLNKLSKLSAVNKPSLTLNYAETRT